MHVHRLERLWLVASLVLIVLFIGTVTYGAVGAGFGMVDDEGGQLDPTEPTASESFREPGVYNGSEPGHYDVYVRAMQFQFVPGTDEPIRIPANSTVTFHVASSDVVHGFEVVGTNVNAGMNINSLIHNTLWVPGHFHLTVGTASALTMMAVSYWLYPQVTGKRLQFYGLAQVQPYIWFIGMALMSNAMHRAGLAGVPRRTAEPQYPQFEFTTAIGSMAEMRLQIAVGGTLLTIGALLFVTVMLGTWFAKRGRGRLRVDSYLPEPISGPTDSPRVLDNVKLWVAIAVVLVAIAYGFPILSMLADGPLFPGAPPVPV